MKEANLAWFLLYTLWPAVISNGVWFLATQKPSNGSFLEIIIFISTLVLSVAYLVVLLKKFVEALDQK